MQSRAKTVEGYLAELPDERRTAIKKVRQTVLDNLPSGFEEVMNWGMITYQVPKSRYPDTYNDQPLMFAALASQKNHMAVYLTSLYSDTSTLERFKADYRASGKKLDMGKSCVRFKNLEDLPIELIGRVIASTTPEQFIEQYEASRKNR